MDIKINEVHNKQSQPYEFYLLCILVIQLSKTNM